MADGIAHALAKHVAHLTCQLKINPPELAPVGADMQRAADARATYNAKTTVNELSQQDWTMDQQRNAQSAVQLGVLTRELKQALKAHTIWFNLYEYNDARRQAMVEMFQSIDILLIAELPEDQWAHEPPDWPAANMPGRAVIERIDRLDSNMLLRAIKDIDFNLFLAPIVDNVRSSPVVARHSS